MDASRPQSRRLSIRVTWRAPCRPRAWWRDVTTTTGTTNDNAAQVRELEATYVVQTYRRAPIVLVRGEGSRVWDSDGRSYLDFTSGVGVAALGHANPGLAAIIAEQARTLIHTSNLFFHPYQGPLAQKLAQLSGLDRVF